MLFRKRAANLPFRVVASIRQKVGAFAGTSRVMAPTETAVPEREYVDYESEIGGQILQEGLNGLSIDFN